MSDLQLFHFGDREVRVIERDGEPWFVAKDVCEGLGLADGRTSIAQLDEDERQTMPVTDSSGRVQEMLIISEPGFYKLVGRSRKPEAKKFDRWVRHEVLPSIRKTGGYGQPVADLTQLEIKVTAVLEYISQHGLPKFAPVESVPAYQQPPQCLGQLHSIRGKIAEAMGREKIMERYRRYAFKEVTHHLRTLGHPPVACGMTDNADLGIYECYLPILYNVVARQILRLREELLQPLLNRGKKQNG